MEEMTAGFMWMVPPPVTATPMCICYWRSCERAERETAKIAQRVDE